MKYTVDRIENNIALLEDDMLMLLPVPAVMLPDGAKEGSILDFDGEKYVLCENEENAQRKKLFELQKSLLNKSKKH